MGRLTDIKQAHRRYTKRAAVASKERTRELKQLVRVRLRAARDAEGLCWECKEPVFRNKLCAHHLGLKRLRQRTNFRNKTVSNHSKGLCSSCNNKTTAGSKLCAKHQELHRIADKKNKLKRKSEVFRYWSIALGMAFYQIGITNALQRELQS